MGSLSSFSVTKVKLAFECPRLFYLVHNEGGLSMFYAPETSNGIGKIFHQLCENSVTSMLKNEEFGAIFKSSSQSVNLEYVNQNIKRLLYESVFFPLLKELKVKKSEKLKLMYKVWQSFEQLINQWSKILMTNSQYFSDSQLFRKTFITEEYNLKCQFSLPDNTQHLVKGRLDSLIFDAQTKRLIVIDYKTYHPVDPSANLIQVALYSYMLSITRGIKVDAAVYILFSQFQEYYYTWEKLETKVYELIPRKLQQMKQWIQWQPFISVENYSKEIDNIFTQNSTENLPSVPPLTSQPHLCKICPQKKKCQIFFQSK